MEVWLIRHGETLWNRARRFQGHQDIALSDQGREEARACQAYLSGRSFDGLFSSDLCRASEKPGSRSKIMTSIPPWMSVFESVTWGFSKAIHVTRFLNYFRMLGPRLTRTAPC